jgi:hypothetical protein
MIVKVKKWNKNKEALMILQNVDKLMILENGFAVAKKMCKDIEIDTEIRSSGQNKSIYEISTYNNNMTLIEKCIINSDGRVSME